MTATCAYRCKFSNKSGSSKGPAAMGILDEFPFPLGKPMAKELLRTMARVYRSEDESIRFVAQYGIDEIDLKPGLSPIDRWQDLLYRLAKKGKLCAAVK